ncbi:MAG: MotA/TolQ/ExbB proton channel family protein [Nevskiales bacterium]|nr:MotA/TolQ/ExbB proton channel family protein [Nevskiales bacterium]
MYQLLDAYESVYQLLERGGDVLLVIMAVIFVMWTLILERFLFLRYGFPTLAQRVVARWEGRPERRSWEAHEIRSGMVAEARMLLTNHLDLIKALVAISPLCGLLGTVTGMMEVFDVMSLVGTGSARNMASGISKATIPTMAGMVGALTGVFFITILDRQTKARTEKLSESLTFDH